MTKIKSNNVKSDFFLLWYFKNILLKKIIFDKYVA